MDKGAEQSYAVQKRRCGSRWLKALAFCIAFFVLMEVLSFLFQPKWTGTGVANAYARINGFYHQKTPPEVVFLGTSCVHFDIDNLKLFQDHGFTSYDFSGPAQDFSAAELYAKEALRVYDPKVIVVEALCIKSMINEEVRSRQALDPLPITANKLEYLGYLFDRVEEYGLEAEYDGAISYLFTLLRYHNRWTELKQEDFLYDQYWPNHHGTSYYHGYAPHFTTVPADYSGYYDDVSLDETAIKENTRILNNIVSICKENGVEVLLIKSPSPNWDQTSSDMAAAVAAECGIHYIDYNDHLEEMGIDLETDFADARYHLNDRGADKFSSYLGEYLQETYDLPDHRDDPEYARVWNEDWEFYQRDKCDFAISNETDWAAYLEKLKDPYYTVFMAARDSLGADKYPELTEQFKTLGLTPELDTAARTGYIAVIDGGKVIYEHLEDVPLTYEAEINGHQINMVSESWNYGLIASIKLDQAERAVNRRGINIVVYDNFLDAVVDSVTFDLWDGGKVYR